MLDEGRRAFGRMLSSKLCYELRAPIVILVHTHVVAAFREINRQLFIFI
jgi:hypothetical protein